MARGLKLGRLWGKPTSDGTQAERIARLEAALAIQEAELDRLRAAVEGLTASVPKIRTAVVKQRRRVRRIVKWAKRQPTAAASKTT